jgi:hypothetical protein
LNVSVKNTGIKAASVSGAEWKNMTGTVAFAVNAAKQRPICWKNTTIGTAVPVASAIKKEMLNTTGTAASASGAAVQAITTGETDAFAGDAERQINTDRTKPMNGTGVFAADAVQKGILSMSGMAVLAASVIKKGMLNMTGTTSVNAGNARRYVMTVISTIPYMTEGKEAV